MDPDILSHSLLVLVSKGGAGGPGIVTKIQDFCQFIQVWDLSRLACMSGV